MIGNRGPSCFFFTNLPFWGLDHLCQSGFFMGCGSLWKLRTRTVPWLSDLQRLGIKKSRRLNHVVSNGVVFSHSLPINWISESSTVFFEKWWLEIWPLSLLKNGPFNYPSAFPKILVPLLLQGICNCWSWWSRWGLGLLKWRLLAGIPPGM